MTPSTVWVQEVPTLLTGCSLRTESWSERIWLETWPLGVASFMFM